MDATTEEFIEKVKRGGSLVRKARCIGDIVIDAISVQAGDQSTIMFSTTVGVVYGLRRDSISKGITSGAAIYMAFIGSSVLYNIMNNIDRIKKS